MSDRLCGYCRQPGHTSAKCNVLNDQVEFILRFTGTQRKVMHRALLSRGAGVGAIVTYRDYWSGANREGLIPTHDFLKQYSFVDYKKLKYKKSVRATLSCYGEIPTIPDHLTDYIRIVHRGRIDVPVYRLSDMSETAVACISINPNEKVQAWEYRYNSEVLSPSEDTDVTDDILRGHVHIHDRLITGKNPSHLREAIID